MKILHRWNNSVIYEDVATTMKDTVVAAVMSRADLSWANLSRANLSRADLSWANLSRANLSRADLSWANLSWANLSWANLSRANGLNLTVIQIQGSRHWLTTLPNNKIAIGCVIRTVEEWLTNYEQIGYENNYSEAQIAEYGEYLKAIGNILKKKEE